MIGFLAKITPPPVPVLKYPFTKAKTVRVSGISRSPAPLVSIGNSNSRVQLISIRTRSRDVASKSTSESSLVKATGTVRYLFVVPEYVTDFGQQLKVVGGFPELGAWDARSAPSMTWCHGHRWQLDVMLPSRPFEFKVVMIHDNYTRWEQGVNRVIQAELDEDRDNNGGKVDEKLIEIIVRVNCSFDRTENTELALMLPKERIQEAFEVARAALEMLDMRRNKLQQEIEKDKAGPSRHLEVSAMREAVAGQSGSVDQLSQLLETPEDLIPLPIGRVPSAASVSGWGSSTSVSTLMQHAAGTFLPPGSPTSDLLLLGGSEEDTTALVAAMGFYKNSPKRDQDKSTSLLADARVDPDVLTKDLNNKLKPQPPVVPEVSVGSGSSIGSDDLSQAQEAANKLEAISIKMKDFFQQNPSPSSVGTATSDGSPLDTAGRSQVKELTALMSEAEAAWDRAAELGSDSIGVDLGSSDNADKITSDMSNSATDRAYSVESESEVRTSEQAMERARASAARVSAARAAALGVSSVFPHSDKSDTKLPSRDERIPYVAEELITANASNQTTLESVSDIPLTQASSTQSALEDVSQSLAASEADSQPLSSPEAADVTLITSPEADVQPITDPGIVSQTISGNPQPLEAVVPQPLEAIPQPLEAAVPAYDTGAVPSVSLNPAWSTLAALNPEIGLDVAPDVVLDVGPSSTTTKELSSQAAVVPHAVEAAASPAAAVDYKEMMPGAIYDDINHKASLNSVPLNITESQATGDAFTSSSSSGRISVPETLPVLKADEASITSAPTPPPVKKQSAEKSLFVKFWEFFAP